MTRLFVILLTLFCPTAAQMPSAPAPVALKDLKPVLDKEFAPVLADWAQTGVVVGISDGDEHRVFAYGTAKDDSIFEIGSLTKTFTALALAQMVEQRAVTLDEPVRDLLPPGTAAQPASGPEITLLDLATQHSGLPRLPDNFAKRAKWSDPYAGYAASDLCAYLAKHGLARPARTEFGYSNLGFGLLGFALANKAGESYAELIRRQVTDPLAMNDTAVDLTPAQQSRLIQGYTGSHTQADTWKFDALSGAGALHSTAGDLLRYADGYLRPDKLSKASGGLASTLPAALRLAQHLQADGPGEEKVALAWLSRPESGVYWHNGGTGGYSSLLIFEPKRDRAIVVLYNCLDLNPGTPQLTDRVAANIRALLDGKPVPPIGK